MRAPVHEPGSSTLGRALRALVVHSVLPRPLTAAAGDVLERSGVALVVHPPDGPVAAGVAAVEDRAAVALLGPFRSTDVAETVAATAPGGLALIAPVATWAGVTRADEPGCDDPADHRGTVFRLVARDTEVAARIAGYVRGRGGRALVVAGEHEYGAQLDGQLGLGGLPRAEGAEEADLVVLCGLVGSPETEQVRALPRTLPVVAFDGVQGADLGDRSIRVALPFAPSSRRNPAELFAGLDRAEQAAELVVEALVGGASTRSEVLAALAGSGAFDEHGDPRDPSVWLWRAEGDWSLVPDEELPPVARTLR